ncbi:hypothetical protein DFJ74DRAFT_386994 [Hyaloraphidium curvatum]|nr:hypothetical protein DFJ74DRAFT_386994 [Hyaloraphidium curvatum]
MLQLPELDTTGIAAIAKEIPYGVWFICGKRGSGKSVLAKWIMSALAERFGLFVAVSSTEGFNRHYSSFLPKAFCHYAYSPEALARIVDAQSRRVKELGVSKETSLLLVLDDVLQDGQELFKDKNLKHIFMNGRHIGICLLLLVQYIVAVPLALRSNVDITISFADDTYDVRQRLWKLAGGSLKYPQFCEFFNRATEGRRALVIVARATKQGKMFWVLAKDAPSLRLGSDLMWSFQRRWGIDRLPRAEQALYRSRFVAVSK